ncbi:MAG: ABC transporter ATP-binding protein [Eubacteriales bacterium]|nr:ABC transporter ATP-binding protein [Eubacteriales bacterium]
MTELLRVEKLRISFPNDQGLVVSDLDLSVAEGEILGICGESGSGKSLTALSLLGLHDPDALVEGSIYYQGRELSGLPEAEWRKLRGQDLALVFQDAQTALNPTMRVGKQVAEGLYIHQPHLSKAEINERVQKLLTDLGLKNVPQVMRAFPHELSGGMRQRIGLAVGLINAPHLLILDEVTTALDPSLQKSLLQLLRKIHDQTGQATIFISHDIRLVREFCERVLIFYAGEKVEEGPARDVFANPAHVYTKLLLDALPGNAGSSGRLVEIPGRVPSSQELAQIMAEEECLCLFANRCPLVIPKCWSEKPPLKDLGNGHKAACHLAEGLYASSWARERQARQRANERGKTQATKESAPKPKTTAQPEMPTPYLLVEEVSHSFYGHRHREDWVLQGINFRIYPRQFTALLGESGSGKSTLARLVSGQLRPLEGNIYLDGREIAHMSRKERRQAQLGIQMIFQDPFSSLHPRQSLARQIEEPLILAGEKDPLVRQEKVLQMMEDVGLHPDLADRLPQDLSGGQQQRVAIACALVTKPKLLIADEALSALDLSVQAQIINLLQQLRQKQDFACLFISHDLDVVRYLCDRVAVLYQGRICEENKTERVFNDPQHPYTKELLNARVK